MRMLSHGVAVALLCASAAMADTVVLKNDDTLHGKIGAFTVKGFKFTTDALGEITLPLDKVKSYKIDTPVVVELKNAPPVTAAVAGDETHVKIDDQPYTFDQIKVINPAPEAWKGGLLANFGLARGNTNKLTIGVDANAMLRRDDWRNNDRLTLTGQYNFGQSGGGPGGDDVVTDTDNWAAFAKYDKFWTEKLYGYVSTKLEHDRIADLNYRLSPNVGLGYQWVETPKTNFFTEAGVGYVFEHFDDDTNMDYVSLRFAYHYEHAFSDTVSAFHNFEYLPAVYNPGDYNLNTDAGLKIKLIKNFIAQLKVEFKRDSTPADGALKNDLFYLIGLGWQF